VHTIFGAVVASVVSIVLLSPGDIFDFSGQLALTKSARVKRTAWAHAAARLALLAVSAVLAAILAPVPLHWAGLLAVALAGLAVHAGRDRSPLRVQHSRGVLTTFTMTLIGGGGVLVVWTALFRANGVAHDVVAAAAFALMEFLGLMTSIAVSSRARVIERGRRYARVLQPFAYALLAVLVLWECGTF
jgi:cadmium resistance protein CadD (predicted permease)